MTQCPYTRTLAASAAALALLMAACAPQPAQQAPAAAPEAEEAAPELLQPSVTGLFAFQVGVRVWSSVQSGLPA